jgi:hypothetical protein
VTGRREAELGESPKRERRGFASRPLVVARKGCLKGSYAALHCIYKTIKLFKRETKISPVAVDLDLN